MTPKEKAVLLHTLMYGEIGNEVNYNEAKRCALIAVDDTLEELHYLTLTEDCNEDVFSSLEYYEKVKEELNKL